MMRFFSRSTFVTCIWQMWVDCRTTSPRLIGTSTYAFAFCGVADHQSAIAPNATAIRARWSRERSVIGRTSHGPDQGLKPLAIFGDPFGVRKHSWTPKGSPVIA